MMLSIYESWFEGVEWNGIHVVHLVRDVLEPRLVGLYPGDHAR